MGIVAKRESKEDSLGKDAISVLSPRVIFSQEPIEWPDKIEILIDDLECESISRGLSREERAVIDVYETVPVLESRDCLHEFWQSSIDQQRVIKSFDLVGASTIVDALEFGSFLR